MICNSRGEAAIALIIPATHMETDMSQGYNICMEIKINNSVPADTARILCSKKNYLASIESSLGGQKKWPARHKGKTHTPPVGLGPVSAHTRIFLQSVH